MKHLYVLLFIMIAFFQVLFAGEEFSCWVDTNYSSPNKVETVGEEATVTEFTEIVVIAVDCDSPTVLKDWYNQEMNRLHDFFDQATFGYFQYDNIVLKNDENNAFMMPNPYTPPFSKACEHVHSIANMQAVLQEADALYDFSAYDFDDDGRVYVHFTSIGPKSGGVVGSCLTYQSNNGVDVKVNKQTRGSIKSVYMNVFKHESGHEFFSFPDMDHGATNYDHYGVGAFDIMSYTSFGGIASPYNPFFRDARNWFHPYYIMEDWENARLNDFQMDGSCYIYKPCEISDKAIDHEKFYISYHKHDPIENYYYSSWPYKEPDLGGMLIWHVKTEDTGTRGDYSDWRKLDVDIEYAHGKYKWDIFPDRVENTFEPDPYTGRDSLEIRIVDSEGHVTGGPFYGRAAGNNGAFYTPGDGKIFNFLSNPNSNWYNKEYSQSYAQNITTGFAVKNLRKEGNEIYADFYISDFDINNDLTIKIPHLYISGNVVVAENACLTIEPGVTVHFDEDCRLTVNGCLFANGTEAEQIVFTSSQNGAGKSSWGGLKLKEYTYSEFNHCRFEYAASGLGFYEDAISYINDCDFFTNKRGLYARNALEVKVTNCTFESNTVGLSFRSCSSSQNWNYAPVENCNFIANGYGIQMFFDASTVANCTISDSYYHGAHIYDSDLVLMNNIIENSTRNGVWITNGSSPDLYFNGYTGGHNRITGNGINGVYNANGCFAELGDFSWAHSQDRSGYNDIYDNADYEVYNNEYNPTLYAEGNWWGEVYSCTTASGNGTDNVIPDPEPALYGDVSWCPALNAPATSSSPDNVFSSQDSSDNSIDLPQKLQQARYLEMSAEYEQAAVLLKNYIQDSPSPAYISYAVLKYSKNLRNFLPVQEAVSTYKYLLSEAQTDVTGFELYYNLIHLLINARDYAEALNITYSLLEGELSIENWCRVKLQQAIIETYFNENRGTGEDIFNEILARDSIPEFYKEFVNNEKGITNFDLQKSIAKHDIKLRKAIKPERFEFFGNYPNPFNPETNFSFKLPGEAQVKIKIFNMSGEEIKVLSCRFNSGSASLKWDGRNNLNSLVPSGMYIYRFIAYPSDKRKEPFVKNGKMLMLK